MTFTPTEYLPYDFANRRHIGPSPAEMAQMLATLGVNSLDELINQAVPASIRQAEPLVFEKPRSERELIWEMRKIAERNEVFTTMIGQGYYGTTTPPAKSLRPVSPNMPPSARKPPPQTQCTTGA